MLASKAGAYPTGSLVRNFKVDNDLDFDLDLIFKVDLSTNNRLDWKDLSRTDTLTY